MALMTAAVLSNVLAPIERILTDWRFQFAGHPASQTLTVVEIDSNSLKDLDAWPWPRNVYATAIENLRRAGAVIIGLDVDLSGKVDPSQNTALVNVLSQGNTDVVLPSFIQPHRSSNGTLTLIETVPEKALRDGTIVASINMTADEDGILRRGQYSFPAADGERPAMGAVLANKAYEKSGSFYIDFGIDLNSITRLSFASVFANNFDPELVRGRKVLIGSTALELGDEFAVPVHKILPGVYLHALSYESIVQNRTLLRPSFILSLVIALALISVLDRQPKTWSWLSLSTMHCMAFMVSTSALLMIQYVWPVSLDAAPILLAQFMCLGTIVIVELERRAHEIHRQRALNARQQALVSVAVKDSSDGIIVTNNAGIVELCNECAATMLRLNPANVIGLSLTGIISDFPVYPSEKSEGAKGNSLPSDCFPIVSERKIFDAHIEIRADWTLFKGLRSEAVTEEHIFVYTMRDISARVRIAEQEREAKEAVIAASAAKTNFIHNMGHELRTPLNAVIGFSDLLLQEMHQVSMNPACTEYASHILNSGKHLLDVVNDVLEVARLESVDVAVSMEETDVKAMIDDVRVYVDSDPRKTFQCNIADGFPTIRVDRWMFKQSLKHLILNAVKFTSASGHIYVSAQQRADGYIIIEVRDDGVGVNPAHLPRLTDAFYQADASLRRKHEGMGLGLFLVSKYLEKHGAHLELENGRDGGFIARMVLPDPERLSAVLAAGQPASLQLAS